MPTNPERGPRPRRRAAGLGAGLLGAALGWSAPSWAQGAMGSAEPAASPNPAPATAAFPEPSSAPSAEPAREGEPAAPLAAEAPLEALPEAPVAEQTQAPAPPAGGVVVAAPAATSVGLVEPAVAAQPDSRYGRHLAFGLGTGTGLGLISAALRVRASYVALEASAGPIPVLAASLGDSRCSELVLAVPMQYAGSLLIFFAPDQKKFVPGMRVAVTHTSAGLDWGGLMGFEGELRLNQPMSLGFGAGLRVLPEGSRWAEAQIRERTDSACVFEDSGANTVFAYLNVQLLLYAF